MLLIKNMAHAVTRVVHRCEDAKESQRLDLSECQLMQVPDAVYHLMRNTELISCNLSGNVITKIPPKLPEKFNLIIELNLSNNDISNLPNEFVNLTCLQYLDISNNAYISIPNSVFKLPNLISLNASNNRILDIKIDQLRSAPKLQALDISKNPITRPARRDLQEIKHIKIIISEETNDWDSDIDE